MHPASPACCTPCHAEPRPQHGLPFARHFMAGLLLRGCLQRGVPTTWEEGMWASPLLSQCYRPRACPTAFTTHLRMHFALNSTKPPEPQLLSQAERVPKCSASSQLSHKPIQPFLFKGCCLCPCGKCIYWFAFFASLC